MRSAADAIAHYRRNFRPSAQLAAPHAMLAVTCVCGEDDADALRQAAPLRLAIVKTRTGKREPIASIADALAYRFSPEEQAIADDFLLGAVIGGPAASRRGCASSRARSAPTSSCCRRCAVARDAQGVDRARRRGDGLTAFARADIG